MRFHWRIVVLIGLTFVVPARVTRAADDAPSFVRDVQPILAANCFACHGPDAEAREASLRLDTRDGATADLGLGIRAIVPGQPDESEMIARVTASSKTDRMPPAKTGKTLTAEQIDTLRRWIANGAKYETHWSFTPPAKPVLPAVTNNTWPRNAIDYFVLARLEKQGLSPSPQADRYTLVRRVYLDLIGLPPTPDEADAFVNDTDPNAYAKIVDRLLASSHYGERWARPWLDLARYADTNGYEKDRPRSIWPYRDWVIDAINADMPFDRFTIEQLAGDMLPNATPSQRVATGFHRNTMLNEEGGIDPLEYRFYATVDRVATTGSVWLGLTTGCAQCHSHKYDPISHTDYYRFMALLNNADEPDMSVPDEGIAARRKQITARIAKLESELPSQFPPAEGNRGEGPVEQRRAANLQKHFDAWVDGQRENATPWRTLRPAAMASNLPKLELLDDGSIFSSGDITKRDVFTLTFRIDESTTPVTALRLEALPDDRLPADGPGRAYYEGRQGDFFLSEVTAAIDGRAVRFADASHSYGKISIGSGNANARNVSDGDGSTGWSTAQGEGEPHQLVLNLAEPIDKPGELTIELLFERHFAASLGRFRIAATSAATKAKASDLPVNVEAILTKPRDKWSEDERAAAMQHYLNVAPQLVGARKPIEQLRKQMPQFPTTLVMQERPADNARPTHRHHRGEYLKPREEVAPGLPAIFRDEQTRDGEKIDDRLAFARWLVSQDNPLVARVTVNRAWQAIFGIGLVATPDDFGTQGEPPSHPELLDWLAVEFVEQGWSRKKLHRLIVTSATYRQSSRISPKLLQRDPKNRLLARGPRFRVEAEMVRDIALRAGGVLSEKLGGPSVFPPQPASVTALAWGGFNWTPSSGEDRYRRSLYTFAKRTTPFAAFTVFDAPSRESCTVRRPRSNTPLAALTMLNDEMFLELAAASAKLTVKVDGSPRDRAVFLFRRWLTRPPREDEVDAMITFYEKQLARLAAGELNAAAIVGEKSATNELAAWSMLARAVMNLDETVTKQ